MKRLVRYYRTRPNASESLFHTALCNQVDVIICKNHKRYENWSFERYSPHPKWLDMSDLPQIIAFGTLIQAAIVIAWIEVIHRVCLWRRQERVGTCSSK